jgi:hypothetical protein
MTNKTALRRGSQEDGNSDYFTGCPIGGGFMWFGLPTKIPSNCMICQDTTLAIASYTKLNENLGGSWGTSGGNLKLPDMRGRFPRGVDSGAGNDPGGRTAIAAGGNVGDAVGSVQDHQSGSHWHGTGNFTQAGNDDWFSVYRPGWNAGETYTSRWVAGESGGASISTISTATWGTGTSDVIQDGSPAENRPKNANVYFVIRVL